MTAERIQQIGNNNKTTHHPDEKPFLLCSYNQVTSNYHNNNTNNTNEYYSPHTQRVFAWDETHKKGSIAAPRPMPDDERDREIRIFEQATNEVWHVYTQLYYGWEGVGSAFFKRSSKAEFCMEGILGVHKSSEDDDADDARSGWDSVHVVQVEQPKSDGTCQYRVQSAVLLTLHPYGGTVVSSSLHKETIKLLKTQGLSLSASHLENLGKIIEEVEIGFRSRLERIDIPHSLDIIDSMYQLSQDIDSGAKVVGLDESEMPTRATGMSVGSSMIDDIASEAQKKKAEGSAFLNHMKAQQEAKEAQLADQQKEYLLTSRSSLKSPKPLLVPKTPTTPTSAPAFAGAKTLLKRTGTLPSAPPLSPASATPEFLNFRSKLKKSGA